MNGKQEKANIKIGKGKKTFPIRNQPNFVWNGNCFISLSHFFLRFSPSTVHKLFYVH